MCFPARRLAFAVLTTTAIVAAAAALTLHRFPAPQRYFMPGPLGAAEPVDRDVGHFEHHAPDNVSPESTGAASSRPQARPGSYRTRYLGLGSPDELDWGHRNAVTPSVAFMHNFSSVLPREAYAEHPEFFPVVDGKRFKPTGGYYWQPDLGREDFARYAAQAASRFFDQHPESPWFSLGINDGVLFGESPETRPLVTPPRWFRGRPDYSPLVFTFMNRAAAELARIHPDKYLGCLAYYWCENTPPFQLDPHVIPFLTADRAQSYDPAFRREELDLQTRWGRAHRRDSAPIGPRLGLYEYYDGYGFLIPRVPIHAFAEHIRHAHAVGFTDYFGEAGFNWGLSGPLPWVVAELLQAPRQNVDSLLDEYYASCFQAAAEPMRRFFDRCEAQWMQQAGPAYWLKYYRSEAQAALFPSGVCRELRALLTVAATAANNDVVRQRVALVSDSFSVTERFVAFQEARATLSTSLLSRSLQGESGVALLFDYLSRRSDFIHTAYDVTNRWPLAFAPIAYDDFLRNDPTFAAGLVLAPTGDSAYAELARRYPLLAPAGQAGRIESALNLLPNGDLSGPIRRGLNVAGLAYGVDLPAPWQSDAEPAEHYAAQLIDANPARPMDGRVLRIEGAESTTVFQWLPAQPGRIYLAAVEARAQVSNSDAVMLTLGWLDAKQRPIGRVTVFRLPDGTWPDWTVLRHGGQAPADAAWVGIGIRVQHQINGDWAELRSFALREAVPSKDGR